MYRQFIIPETDRYRILDGCRIGVDYGQWITSDDAGLFRCRFPDYDQPVFSKYRCRMESDVSESKSAGFILDTGYSAISSDLGIGTTKKTSIVRRNPLSVIDTNSASVENTLTISLGNNKLTIHPNGKRCF